MTRSTRRICLTLLTSLITWSACSLPAQAAEAGPQTDMALAELVIDAVNRYRAAQQLPALRPSAALTALAAEHSDKLARLHRLSHAGFYDRFERSRRTTCVENLAAGFNRAESMLSGWRQSPDHHRNLLDARVQEVGVASVAGHVTWLACSSGGVN